MKTKINYKIELSSVAEISYRIIGGRLVLFLQCLINYDYIEASPLIIKQTDSIDYWLIGAGGTGSWLSYHIARLARSLSKPGKKVRLAFAKLACQRDRRSRYS